MFGTVVVSTVLNIGLPVKPFYLDTTTVPNIGLPVKPFYLDTTTALNIGLPVTMVTRGHKLKKDRQYSGNQRP
jgi:hypothetical protein